MSALIDRIDAKPSMQLSLDKLANLAGCSKRHFLRRFHAETGTSPHQYILNKRLESAYAQILDSSDPLTEIALRCGFSSDSHMASLFRRRFHISPGELRRRNDLR
ncbi:helix-turn-helix domain-containing protein [Granulicella sp. L60]|uniref:helix-turn-helix domain-containing protein n=1 Tax=Granulicella sp. L60 TaxID=1641866 RepID=UPI00131B7A24|nr:helix-turn-helix transcriptional regulator [Granulicella sp. L60]